MSPPSANDDVSTSDYPSYEYVDAGIAHPTLFPRANQHPATDAEHQPLLGQSVRVKYRSGSRAEALVIVVCIACTTGVSSLLNGHVIVALPMMADDLGLSVDLVLVITCDTSNIRNPTNICLLGLSLALMPAFVAWVHRQEHNDRPALIPNSLWSNKGFTSICINVFLMWGAFNAFEQVLNLVFQKVKGLDAFAAALAFLPMPISGLLAYPAVGLVVHRIRADWIVLATTVASCVSPLLMALSDPTWSYWVGAFPALLLNATASDSLFTISNLLIMSVFPGNTQGLAGGVFSTIAQIGKSMGLAVVALLAESITTRSPIEDKESPEALMEGYRAAFWFLFALSAASFFVSFWGLHGIGKVGRATAA
ncbi:MAG: hypothetical protein Q9171_005333 [Xanthocarpia ochracea]